MRKKNIGKVLHINTTFPTIEGVPADDVQADLVDAGKTSTAVGWPDNWTELTPKWRAQLLARLVQKVINSLLSGGSPNRDQATFTEFRKITGWGGPIR